MRALSKTNPALAGFVLSASALLTRRQAGRVVHHLAHFHVDDAVLAL